PRIACLCSGLLSRRLMSLLLFFFSHSCSLRVLHSFPTRRSSDLDGFVSALDVDAVTVLLMTVPLGMVPSGCTLIVNCALPPLAKSEIVQVTVPPLFGAGGPHVAVGPVFCSNETNATPEGGMAAQECTDA